MNTLEPGNFYVFRTPLLERSHIDALSKGKDLTEIRQHLQADYQKPELQQALYIASPDLFGQLERWEVLGDLPQPSKKQQKDLNNLDQKFLMFLLRAAYRCTPFGTFATVTVGELKLQKTSNLEFTRLAPLRKSSRLDMVYLLRLKSAMEADTQVREALRYFPNNTLYRNGDDMLCSFFDEKKLQHVASSKGFNEIAWELFEECKVKGGMRIAQMVEFLIDPEFTSENCREFIDYLIDHHLLISELYPSLNGEEYLKQLHNKIKDIATANKYLTFIQEVRRQLHQIDATESPKEGLALYQQLATYLNGQQWQESEEKEGTKTQKELIQVDAFRDIGKLELSKTVARDISRKIEVLASLPTPNQPSANDLEIFKQAFFKRYENEAVSLLQVMDEVTGLGYPYGKRMVDLPDYLKELGVAIPEGMVRPQGVASTPKNSLLDDLLEQKYVAALQNNEAQISLTQADIKQLSKAQPPSPDQKPLPPAMVAMGKLLYGGSDDLLHDPKNGKPRNYHFQLYHASGPIIGNLLGRFCYGSSSLKEHLSNTIAEVEPDNDEVVYAEIDHLPGQRVGNVIIRPRLRNYSIVLGGANTNVSNEIPVADLWLSMPNGQELVLHSQKLGKQVIPRMSNAHNYANNAHPIYKLLCDLQYQNDYHQLPSFFKSSRWQQRSYLPRLVYENLILSPRQWRVNAEIIKSWGIDKKGSLVYNKVAKIRQQLNLPKQVLIVEGDNKLYIDFANAWCSQIFLQKVLAGKQILLEEVIERYYPSQSYSNEMIFPIINIASQNKQQIPPLPTQEIKKNFGFGSEWIYYKIYLGTLGSDRLIVQTLLPLSEQLQANGKIKKWFFIRYTDAEYGTHLRWRLHLHNTQDFGEVVQVFSQTLLQLQQHGNITHSTPDTYQRELNRYLPYNIATSEEWFALDSWFVGQALHLLTTNKIADLPTEQLKLALAIKRIQAFLRAFELPEETRQKIIAQGKASYQHEFGFDKHPQRKKLKASLAKVELSEALPLVYEDLFAQLTIKEQPLARQIRANLQHDDQLLSLLPSYIHMFVNRFFASVQRLEEMWVYGVLNNKWIGWQP